MNRLDAIVARHDLNQHPFYRAWRAGTLPRAALSNYSADYAPFIQSVEDGWRSLGDEEHARTEREHAGLWEQFRQGVGEASAPASDEARALATYARQAFADPVTAIGALYAFEAQQPKTAESKLAGLVEHYALPEAALEYFRVHANGETENYGERDELGTRAAALDPEALSRAERACETMCRSMWSALDGVMASSGACG